MAATEYTVTGLRYEERERELLRYRERERKRERLTISSVLYTDPCEMYTKVEDL